jgi:hypothetical protein
MLPQATMCYHRLPCIMSHDKLLCVVTKYPHVTISYHVLPRVTTSYHVLPHVSTSLPHVTTCYHRLPHVFTCHYVLLVYKRMIFDTLATLYIVLVFFCFLMCFLELLKCHQDL